MAGLLTVAYIGLSVWLRLLTTGQLGSQGAPPQSKHSKKPRCKLQGLLRPSLGGDASSLLLQSLGQLRQGRPDSGGRDLDSTPQWKGSRQFVSALYPTHLLGLMWVGNKRPAGKTKLGPGS